VCRQLDQREDDFYGAPRQYQAGLQLEHEGNVPFKRSALGNSANNNILGNFATWLSPIPILSVPQMSATLRACEDADAEFSPTRRIVTADNLQAKIEINRAQPVPQLTSTNRLPPSLRWIPGQEVWQHPDRTRASNKDNFVTLKVKPEISNKVGDHLRMPRNGSSPIIDTARWSPTF